LDPLLLFTIRAHPAGGEVKMSTQAVGFFFSSLALRSAPEARRSRSAERGAPAWLSGAAMAECARGGVQAGRHSQRNGTEARAEPRPRRRECPAMQVRSGHGRGGGAG